MNNDFLGVGLSFPLALDEAGQLQLARREESIRQSIWMILSTSRGERMMRPDFGCAIHDLVFGVNSAATAGEIAGAVEDALIEWEPRIDVLAVNAFPDPQRPNYLLIEISYQVRSTNSRFNLVYPFYLG
ncbi:MAG: GPW/gp25 family protein [Caldilineaceae bacterium]